MRTLKLISNLKFLNGSSSLTKDDVDTLVQNRFRKVVTHAYNSSPFYRDLYSAHGIQERDLASISSTDLPIIDKTMIMDNFESLFTGKKYTCDEVEEFLFSDNNPLNRLDGNTVIHTSGSSGRIGIFFYSPDEWVFLLALAVSRVSRPKFHLLQRIRMAFIGAIDGHYAGVSLTSDAPRLFYRTRLFSSAQDLDSLIEELNRYNPHVLSGYASVIYKLALAKLEGKLKIEPDRVLSSGEPLNETMRLTVDMAFRSDVVNFYASTESLAMGVQYHQDSPFNLFSDWNLFETVGKDDKILPAGSSGTLILTPLYRFMQPLIRYRMSDEISVKNDGGSFLELDSLSGRSEETLTFVCSNGEILSLSYTLLVEFFVPGVRQFQFEQRSRNKLVLRIEIFKNERNVVRNAESLLNKILENSCLADIVTTEVVVVDEIPIESVTGKYRLIIPYCEK